ncbi:DUF1444 family protein [Psychrosphaera saromensis]|uniref:DUF1444 family protein n=1 Tax=Psychrosphaera saromensis TaxID=716813 RepID=UPI0015E2A7C4|nr:DUF1444 family protein [Psychrosphaera saromensis]
MKYLLIAFVLIFVTDSVAADYISKDEFTNRYITIIQKKNTELLVKKTASLAVEYETKSGLKQSSNLHNAYLQYKANPEDLSPILEQYSNSLLENALKLSTSLDKSRIFPVIKDKSYILQISLMAKAKYENKGMPFLYKKLNEVLYLVFALDTQNSMRFLNENDLIKLELKQTELLPLSIENLKREFAGLSVQGDPSSLSMLVADGNYEASFFVVDSLWDKKIFPVKGDIVVHMPSRDTVLITGSEDLDGLKRVSGIISKNTNNLAYPITNIGFIRINGAWELYKPK